MDDILRRSRRWNLPLLLLFYRGIPSAFFICSLEFIAPQRQNFWCVHDDALLGESTGFYPSDALLRNCTWSHLNGSVQNCEKWLFDTTTEYGNTFTSEFNAVCDRHWLRAWAQSALMFGMMLGNLLFSHVSDWYGRRITCLLSHCCILLGGIACAGAQSFQTWIALRVILALGLGGNQNGPFTLGMESTGPENRALLALADSFGWVAGMIILPVFPAFIRDWRILQFAISLSTIPMLTIVWFVDESPRWLVATERIERARNVLKNLLRSNGMPHEEEDVESLLRRCVREHKTATASESQQKVTFFDLIRTPKRILTTASFFIQYPINIFVYYSLLYYIIKLDTGGLFSNLLWAGIFETPTLLLVFVLIRRFKRRTLHVICNTPAIFACALLYLYPNKLGGTSSLILAVVGKMGVQVGFSVLGVHVNELFPTKVRGIALGSCITISRIGAIVAPFAGQQTLINENIFNSCGCLVSLLAALPLQETFGRSLPDDFEDSSPATSCTQLGQQSLHNK